MLIYMMFAQLKLTYINFRPTIANNLYFYIKSPHSYSPLGALAGAMGGYYAAAVAVRPPLGPRGPLGPRPSAVSPP